MFKQNTKRISRVTEGNRIPTAVTEKANALRQRFSNNALNNKKSVINSTPLQRKTNCTTRSIKPNTKKSKSNSNKGETIEITKVENVKKRETEINPEFHNFFFAYKPPFESKPANFRLRQIAHHYKLNLNANIKGHKKEKGLKQSKQKEWTFFPNKAERNQ